MKKLLTLTLFMYGCDRSPVELSQMKRPVIIIGKSSRAIVLKAKDGQIAYFSADTYLGGALVNSYNLGDTLK